MSNQCLIVSTHQKQWNTIQLTDHGRKLADRNALNHDTLEEEYKGKLHENTIEVLNSFGWRRIYRGEI